MKNLDSERLVFDNAVLSNFARIKKLDLLLKLPCELITTKEVIAEIRNGIKAFSIKNDKRGRFSTFAPVGLRRTGLSQVKLGGFCNKYWIINQKDK